jgi:hypothetical protein
VTRKKREKPLSDTKPRSSTPPGCLVPFFAVFLVVGLLAGKTFLWEPLRNSVRARSWIQAPCLVLSSEVKRHAGDETDTFSVAIRYRYEFGGVRYESGRYDFEPRPSSGRRAKRAIVARYPAGTETTCVVNPDDPSEAVIDRGLGSWAWSGLFPLPFILAGAGGIWWVIRSRRDEKRKREEREARFRGESLPKPPEPSASVQGPLTLKPKQGAGVRAAGTGCVALFWNGIVATFVTLASRDWIAGEGPWFATLFLVPFVLVGLALLWAFLKTLRGLAAPRPVLTLEPATIRLGSDARLSWGFQGRTRSLSSLQVTLEGSEEATYSRGTDRVTDRTLFHRSDVVRTPDPFEATTGATTFHVPSGTVPTLSAPSNRVVWLLRLTARIQGTDDVKEEYEFTVLPPVAPGRFGG